MILLVDDDPNILEACQLILASHDFHAIPCSSGEEALQAFSTYQNEINLIITDYSMPKMNGIELIQSIRMRQPNIKAILISGNFDGEVPANVKLLRKPFPFDTLIESIEIYKKVRPN